MKTTSLLPLLFIVSLSLALPASAGVLKAVMPCSAEPRRSAAVAGDYLFYHGLVSTLPVIPAGKETPPPPCPRSKVTRT